MTAQQLKNSILQMAVQGKLVPQNPDDEPASVLLERIKAEKEELIKLGKIKKGKKTSEIFRGSSRNLPYAYCEQVGKEIRDISEEVPFEIPDSWEWCRLGYIGDWGSGATPSRTNTEYYNGNIPWLKTGDLNDGIITDIPETISDLALEKTSVRLNPVGSVLIAMYGATIGKLGILSIPATTNQACCACLPIRISNKFLFYFLMAHKVKFIKSAEGGAQPNISKEKIISTLMPVPPIQEQHRIVTKIEELLPYIEKYAQAETQLNALNTSFPEALKKSILQEAVQGRLVPQDPNDEPASVLLERIRAEKQALIKAGKIKKDKHESVIVTRDKIPYESVDGKERCIADEVPFDIPESWCWCRLGTISWYFDAGKSPNCIKQSVTGDEYGVITTTSIQIGYFDENQNKLLPLNFEVKEDMKVNSGDILITRAGPMNRTGIACVVKDIHYNLILSDKTIRINMTDDLFDKDYIVTVLNSPNIREQIIGLMSGMDKQQVNISQDKYKTVFIPLPPLVEQKRIVAKIEELMQYCDKLK